MSSYGKRWNWSEEQKEKARGRRPASDGNQNGKTHGLSKTRAYNSWKKMRQRCCDPENKDYQYYGARGITMDPRWEDVRNFFEDMGEREKGQSLERIDVQGNYEPGNCCWIDMAEQAKNRTEWRHTEEGLRKIGEATTRRNLLRDYSKR